MSMLAIAPQAKGLFRRAISESGGSFAPARSDGEGGENIPTLASAEAQGQAFLAKVGVKTIAEARSVPADALVKAAGPTLGAFWPVLDGQVLPGDAYRLYEAGRFNDTPVLIGTNEDEGALFIRSATASAWVSQVRAQYGAKAEDILRAYPAGDDAAALRSARDLMRDSGFGWHTWVWARLQSQKGRGKAYVYYFTHRPPRPPASPLRDAGATHADEMAYVFGHLPPTATAADQAVSQTMMGYWTNFAKTGDPNGPGLPAWPAFSDADARAMRLDAPAAVIAYPNLDKLKVLDGYYAWRRDQEK